MFGGKNHFEKKTLATSVDGRAPVEMNFAVQGHRLSQTITKKKTKKIEKSQYGTFLAPSWFSCVAFHQLVQPVHQLCCILQVALGRVDKQVFGLSGIILENGRYRSIVYFMFFEILI